MKKVNAATLPKQNTQTAIGLSSSGLVRTNIVSPVIWGDSWAKILDVAIRDISGTIWLNVGSGSRGVSVMLLIFNMWATNNPKVYHKTLFDVSGRDIPDVEVKYIRTASRFRIWIKHTLLGATYNTAFLLASAGELIGVPEDPPAEATDWF